MLYHLNPRDQVRPALEPPVGPQRLTVTQHQLHHQPKLYLLKH
jgi:hypothetical protein